VGGLVVFFRGGGEQTRSELGGGPIPEPSADVGRRILSVTEIITAMKIGLAELGCHLGDVLEPLLGR